MEKEKQEQIITSEDLYVNDRDIKIEIPIFICNDYLPLSKNKCNMLSAFGGQGKSWIALNTAIYCANSGLKVLYFSKELTAGRLKLRKELLLKTVLTEKGNAYFNLDMIEKNMFYNKRNSDFTFFAEKDFDLIILDPYLSFFDGDDENQNKANRAFIEKFTNFGNQTATTILFIHHSRKDSEINEFQTRGAGAIIDSVQVLYEIASLKKSNKLYDDGYIERFDKNTDKVIVLKKDNEGIAEKLNLINDEYGRVLRAKPAIEKNNKEIKNEKILPFYKK